MVSFGKVNGSDFGSRKVSKMAMTVGGASYFVNNYNRVTHARQNTTQRIVTGQKFPNASAGASEYSIAARLLSNIGATSQSITNTQNIGSAIRIAEGATKNTIEGISKIRGHVINAMNDSNGASDRRAIQKEINHIVSQINSNAYVEYNGKKLLDGSENGLVLAGIDGYENFQAGDLRTSTLGLTDDQGNVKIDVSTIESAANSLDVVDRATAIVGDILGGISLLEDYVTEDIEGVNFEIVIDMATSQGAQLQGLAFKEANYVTMEENQIGSLSAINDADIAMQVSEMHTQQVLEQIALFGMKLFNLNRENVIRMLQ